MSYILDALKKAERERGIAKVPNLETIHKTPGNSNKILWLSPAIVLILLMVGTGVYFLFRDGAEKTIPDSKDYASQQEPAEMSDSNTPRTLPAGEQQVPAYPSVPADSSSAPVSSGAAGQVPAIGTNRDGTPSISPGDSLPESKSMSPATESSLNHSLEENNESYPDDSPIPFPSPAIEADTTSHTAVLQQAMQEMRVSIHQYSETPSKRMIFIDGRKYQEGDYINGIYLIERITPDGVVLRYEDAQATLKVSM